MEVHVRPNQMNEPETGKAATSVLEMYWQSFNGGLLAKVHLDPGGQRVLLSAPAKTRLIATVRFRCEWNQRDASLWIRDSNGSCTTTGSAAPLAKALHDAFGIGKRHHDPQWQQLYREPAQRSTAVMTIWYRARRGCLWRNQSDLYRGGQGVG